MAAFDKKKNALFWEIGGIALMGLGIYLTISLFSYNPKDPSFNTLKTTVKEVYNWGGRIGAYTSDILLTYIGITSFTIPLILLILSLEMMIKREINLGALRPLFFILFIFALSGLLSILLGEVDLFKAKLLSGGLVGEGIRKLVEGYFNRIGAVLILIILLSVSTILTTGLSIVNLLVRLWKGWRYLFNRLKTSILIYRAKRERGKRVIQERMARERTLPRITTSAPISKILHDEPLQGSFEFMKTEEVFHLPPISLLDSHGGKKPTLDKEGLLMNSRILEKKLADFGVTGKVVEVHPGPVITLYEFEPAPGIKINSIVNLSHDLALALKAMSIRIIAPIPGKAVVGIEVPNNEREDVDLKEIIGSEAFKMHPSILSLALGKDIVGNPFIADLCRMPHLLIAGSTGAGKSVSLNVMILSILYKATPEAVRFVMIDPKRLELSAYDSIPHLLCPVVTDVKRATSTLKGILLEMEERYRIMADKGVKNIEEFNRQLIKEGGEKRLPYIVVVIDEMADLMMTSGREFEDIIIRLAQMARAAGIHLIVATQRPSVDVVTGLIKANFPARIAFQVPSRTDSRTILDTGGAEKLLGKGDMLFLLPGTSKVQRIHGAYVSEIEIRRVVDFIKKQGKPSYMDSLLEIERMMEAEGIDDDDKYEEAVDLVMETGQASISFVQRRLRVGYNRAARMIERMEREGIVGPAEGGKPREVLKR